MSSQRVIAIDLGATSGRVMQVDFDGQDLQLTEAHRFPNIPVKVQGTLHWDVLRLWDEIQLGIDKVENAKSIGVDAWGVDFALLDKQGRLLANPFHYRDSRNDGMMEWAFERIPKREIYDRTGIQFMQINGLYQMASLLREESQLLDIADTALTIADLFNYFLCGAKTCEFTQATTWQIYNPNQGNWDNDIISKVGLPRHIFPQIVPPGTTIGDYQGTDVIAPACHDTGSAVVAVPMTSRNTAYISSGTWSLMGMELDAPVINDASFEANLTNEGGVNNTYRLLRNIMGMWLMEESRRTWRQGGDNLSYEEMMQMAESASPFQAFIDPDDTSFLAPGDIPARVQDYCKRTNQPIPQSKAEILATIYCSLAFKYRRILDHLITVSGQSVDRLHIIGGGANNSLLCQMTASAIGGPVIAGPSEATALGNAIVQLIALGELADLQQAREMLSSQIIGTYEPKNHSEWEAQYQRFQEII